MSALFSLFLCFRSYSEKLEEYIPTFYKIRYISEELYVAVMWIISRLTIYIDQLNKAIAFKMFPILCISLWCTWTILQDSIPWNKSKLSLKLDTLKRTLGSGKLLLFRILKRGTIVTICMQGVNWVCSMSTCWHFNFFLKLSGTTNSLHL